LLLRAEVPACEEARTRAAAVVTDEEAERAREAARLVDALIGESAAPFEARRLRGER